MHAKLSCKFYKKNCHLVLDNKGYALHNAFLEYYSVRFLKTSYSTTYYYSYSYTVLCKTRRLPVNHNSRSRCLRLKSIYSYILWWQTLIYENKPLWFMSSFKSGLKNRKFTFFLLKRIILGRELVCFALLLCVWLSLGFCDTLWLVTMTLSLNMFSSVPALGY